MVTCFCSLSHIHTNTEIYIFCCINTGSVDYFLWCLSLSPPPSSICLVVADVYKGVYFRGNERWNKQGGAPPMPAGNRWDALLEDRERERRMGGQGYNRWDNRVDNGGDDGRSEDWSIPLPRNERLEQWVVWFLQAACGLCDPVQKISFSFIIGCGMVYYCCDCVKYLCFVTRIFIVIYMRPIVLDVIYNIMASFSSVCNSFWWLYNLFLQWIVWRWEHWNQFWQVWGYSSWSQWRELSKAYWTCMWWDFFITFVLLASHVSSDTIQ